MAKYNERDGKLMPVDAEGRQKKGAAFSVAGSSRKSFAQLAREKTEAAQQEGGGESPEVSAAPAPAPSTPPPPAPLVGGLRCEKCGEVLTSVEAARKHKCRPKPRPVKPAGPPPDQTRRCEHCNRSIEHLRPNARYCDSKCKRKASYRRKKGRKS